MKFTLPLITGVLMLQHVHAAVLGPASGTVGGSQPATMLEVNHTGVGHVNLVPYFSTQSDFVTHVHLINTDTRNGKAVKVRLRSAHNGEDVFNFTVLLAAGDMLAFALARESTSDYPRLITEDRSCTLPAQVASTMGPSYLVDSVTPPSTEAPYLAHEGSVEIITMADIPPLTSDGQASALYTAISSARSCAETVLAPLVNDSTSYEDARGKGLEVPTTGLMTQWILINVPRAVGYGGRATAIEARVAAGGAPGYGNIVMFPQTSTQVVDEARTIAYTTSPLTLSRPARNAQGNPIKAYVENQMPDLSTPYLPSGLATNLSAGTAPRVQASAISSALATSSIGGETLTSPEIAAATDWVVTLPTRYLQVGYLAGGLPGLGIPITTDWTHDAAGQPVAGAKNFFAYGESGNLVAGFYPICIIASFLFPGIPSATQSETTFRSYEGTAFLPWQRFTSEQFRLCGHSSVTRFISRGDAEFGAMGSARNARPLGMEYSGSWGRINTPGINGAGLPVIGFSAVELYNGSVAPVISGFGLTYPLTTTRP